MTWDRYREAIIREFPKGTSVEQTREGVAITVPCAEGHDSVQAFNKRMPPNKARKHMANNGWRFWGTKTRCPEHAAHRHSPKPEQEKDETMNDNGGTMEAAMSEAGLASSEKVREAKRLATMLIDDKFDVMRGRYRDGFTDAKVAHETGVSAKWVAERREEDYGPLKEPPEFTEFREGIEALSREAEKIRADAEQTVKALLSQIGKMRERLEETIKRNGW